MNRQIVIVIALTIVMTGHALGLDGAGAEEEPWLIQSLADFDAFAGEPNYWDDYTRLETDIDLAGRVYDRAVIAWNIDPRPGYWDGVAFEGVFDGNGYKIQNMAIDDGGVGNGYLGLFGSIFEGEVSNLGLEGGSIDGGESPAGGMVGANDDGTITNCYAMVAVTCDAFSTVGGLVGYSSGGTIRGCYATGSVTGGVAIGGLVGEHGGTITNCYATGTVTGDGGGLVGIHWDGTITNCYATGNVDPRGLVEWNIGTITNSFWDTETSGTDQSDGGTGLPTSQLQQQSTFTDWDFINVWNIGEGQTYPYLRTVPASDLNKDKVVNLIDLSIMAEQWMSGF